MGRGLLTLAATAARLFPKPVKQALYRIRPLGRMIRQSLNRAAPQGLTTVTVAAGGLAGVRLELDLQTEKDYWLGTYEPDLQQAVADLVQPGQVVYDVGANIGYVSLLLAQRVRELGHVYAFEALPSNQERLRTNLALNNMASRVELFTAAVVDCARQVRFLIGPSNGMGKAEGSAGRASVTYSESIEVEGISLDEFVFDGDHLPPQVVKIDVEGGEILVLPGMQGLLMQIRPLLLLELHGPEAARIVWDMLSAANYRFCRMKPGYPEISSFEALDWKAYLVAMSL